MTERPAEGRRPATTRGGRVTLLALPGETEPLVIGVARGLEVGQVARHAVRGRVHELPGLLAPVAGLAVQRRVRREQGKARPVVHAEELAPVGPRLRNVAGVAGDAQLSPVRVRVAVRAGSAHVGEDEVAMAAAAGRRSRRL